MVFILSQIYTRNEEISSMTLMHAMPFTIVGFLSCDQYRAVAVR